MNALSRVLYPDETKLLFADRMRAMARLCETLGISMSSLIDAMHTAECQVIPDPVVPAPRDVMRVSGSAHQLVTEVQFPSVAMTFGGGDA